MFFSHHTDIICSSVHWGTISVGMGGQIQGRWTMDNAMTYVCLSPLEWHMKQIVITSKQNMKNQHQTKNLNLDVD